MFLFLNSISQGKNNKYLPFEVILIFFLWADALITLQCKSHTDIMYTATSQKHNWIKKANPKK